LFGLGWFVCLVCLLGWLVCLVCLGGLLVGRLVCFVLVFFGLFGVFGLVCDEWLD
jgi:hypothetical protein